MCVHRYIKQDTRMLTRREMLFLFFIISGIYCGVTCHKESLTTTTGQMVGSVVVGFWGFLGLFLVVYMYCSSLVGQA
ncbi:uncharacterized protein LOC127840925 isoform X2 [Dreissena polymorpha]|uniref:uncharacterized protein LOC127840925 isoform X2 n=1 Tax=Dreissena polymorpha TaxID=45954 RepID=UPI0022651E5D|nr:uncharacterized protein LOC127840925 isoform X2 [Dreissena polymorpha]